jgi:NADH:ubiquinone oxidoreductase subunit H
MLTVAYEIAWLFVVLPLLEATHLRFFSARHPNTTRESQFFAWYLEFVRVLKRSPAQEIPIHIAFARKGLLFTAIVLPLVGFSLFISGSFSVLFVLSLLLCFGLIDLLTGFTFDRHFISLSALEKSGVRQGLILIVLTALLVSPFFDVNTTIHEMLLSQMKPLTKSVPGFLAFVNPIAFMCVCFGMSLYLRHWDDNEFPLPDSLRRPLQSELFGIDLLSYKIARGLEHLLFYTLIVFVFLGGPYLQDTGIDFIPMLAILTAKVIFVVCFVLCIYYAMPRIQERQTLRLIFLVILPLILASYPLSQFVLNYFAAK